MKGDNLFIGIDSGTQGTKGIVYSERENKVVAAAHVSYGMVENDRGGREQNPELWLDACRKVIRAVCASGEVRKSEIRAVGISGQQHGFVPLDSNGKVIRPAKLWCDTETVGQCETLTEKLGGTTEVVDQTGNVMAAGFTASKVLWLKENEPENYDRLHTILLPHDYLNFWLTGERVTEYGDASGTAYFNVEKQEWSEKVLTAIDQGGRLVSCLPRLIESDEPSGKISSTIAEELGLPVDVLVSSGGGDNMMAAIGTGNVEQGIVTASLGTSGTIYAYSETPVVDPSGELAAFCSSSGGWLPLVCTMNVTVATELTRSLLGVDLEEMNELVESAEPGSHGLLLLPYFQGERTPPLPEATATLAGITSMNYTAANICRAAMEGASFGLRYGLDVMKRNGVEPTEIRLVGGGAKSQTWKQMVADIFNCPIVALQDEEAGAIGAAIQASWCWKKTVGEKTPLKDLTDKAVKVERSKQCFPDTRNASRYGEIYENYLALNRKMHG